MPNIKSLVPEGIKRIIWKTARLLDTGGLILRYYPKSILLKDGWFTSFRKELPIDRNGNAIPWYTYSFINFIKPRLNNNMRVFEYGSGYSSIWFSQRVKEVVSVENNREWAKRISLKLPENCTLVLKESPEEYVCEINNYAPFDIVVIDGINREKCWQPAFDHLKGDGVIFWDNSDRPDFIKSFDHMKSLGFREIPFYGIAPGTFVTSQTSILYRPYNCFNL